MHPRSPMTTLVVWTLVNSVQILLIFEKVKISNWVSKMVVVDVCWHSLYPNRPSTSCITLIMVPLDVPMLYLNLFSGVCLDSPS